MGSKSSKPSTPVRSAPSKVENPKCVKCATAFTAVIVQHHCRKCRGVVCGNCSKKRAIVPACGSKEQRVCDACYDLLQGRPGAPQAASPTAPTPLPPVPSKSAPSSTTTKVPAATPAQPHPPVPPPAAAPQQPYCPPRLKQPVEKDTASRMCPECHNPFSTLRRRQNCPNCGTAACVHCAARHGVVRTTSDQGLEDVRVCHACYGGLKGPDIVERVPAAVTTTPEADSKDEDVDATDSRHMAMAMACSEGPLQALGCMMLAAQLSEGEAVKLPDGTRVTQRDLVVKAARLDPSIAARLAGS